MISLRGMLRPTLSNHGGPVQAVFFRLWMAATICWLVYLAVVSSVSPYGFGIVEFLLAIMLPAVVYFVMFFVAHWIVKGIRKNS
jgi:hypothetical protein